MRVSKNTFSCSAIKPQYFQISFENNLRVDRVSVCVVNITKTIWKQSNVCIMFFRLTTYTMLL